MLPKNLISELSEEQLDELLAYAPSFSQKNLENIKRLSLEKLNPRENRRRTSMKKLIAIVAAAVLFLITSSALFAASGGLEYFLARFNTNFGELAIAPLYPAYSEQQGIRIEAVGAQQIDHVVLVYVAMQDVSGENRLTQHMWPSLEIYIDGEIINGPGTSNRLEFDHSTNTLYFEKIIVGEVGMPWADTIELVANHIDCYGVSGPVRRVFEGEWRITVNSSDLGITPIVWENVTVGNIHIERMSLSPFGVQINGSHSYEAASFPLLDTRIEFGNRLFRTKLPSGGGGIGYDWFSSFKFSQAPIDLDAVTAIIINGERIPTP
jgi:hypothetical protein